MTGQTIISANRCRLEKMQRKPFNKKSYKLHKQQLFKEQKGCCLICRNSEWNNQPIALEIDHIDGNYNNNTRSNLRLICPNCHAQTETYRGKNTLRATISEKKLIKAIEESPNIRQVLIKVGLSPRGLNYNRVKRIMAKRNITFFCTPSLI